MAVAGGRGGEAAGGSADDGGAALYRFAPARHTVSILSSMPVCWPHKERDRFRRLWSFCFWAASGDAGGGWKMWRGADWPAGPRPRASLAPRESLRRSVQGRLPRRTPICLGSRLFINLIKALSWPRTFSCRCLSLLRWLTGFLTTYCIVLLHL